MGKKYTDCDIMSGGISAADWGATGWVEGLSCEETRMYGWEGRCVVGFLHHLALFSPIYLPLCTVGVLALVGVGLFEAVDRLMCI